MRRTGNQLGITGLVLLSIATALQFIDDVPDSVLNKYPVIAIYKVPVIVTGIALQWTSIVFFVIAGIRRPRAWFIAPITLLALIALLVWIER